MKASLLAWSLLSLLAIPTLAASPDADLESTSNNKPSTTDLEPVPSKFNNIEVPPITLLTPDNYEDILKDEYWYACPFFAPHSPSERYVVH
jgi:protein disulfide-isomerase